MYQNIAAFQLCAYGLIHSHARNAQTDDLIC